MMPSAPPEPPHTASVPSTPRAAERLLRELEWTVIRRLDGLRQGDYASLLRGSGLDLADLRAYHPGDDVRHIDWNVTARLNEPHVRVFTEEREMATWLLLDLSPSVRFGPPGRGKHDQLCALAGVLARLLTRHGNRVGALLYGGPAAPALDAVLPPRHSRQQVLQLLHLLHAAPAPRTGPGHTTTDLRPLLQAAQAQLRRRSTVIVVSDFISPPGWEVALGQLVHRHDVVAVRLLDPLEQALPDVGQLLLRDAETGETLHIDTHDSGFRQRFAQLASARESELRHAFAQAGADTLELRTDGDLVDALLRFLDLRAHRVRPAAHRSASAHARPLAATPPRS